MRMLKLMRLVFLKILLLLRINPVIIRILMPILCFQESNLKKKEGKDRQCVSKLDA